MALQNVMRVDNGNIIGGGGGASKNFQGTIEEWNALTTEQKKAYDHASIPDSLDGNVTFPASKVMLNNGDSVEEAVSDLKPVSDVEYIPNTTNLNNISIRRSGNVVVMNLQTKSIAANTSAELLTIAEGYRPNNNIITMVNNGDVTKFGQLMLEASTGKLTAYGANRTAYYGSLTYIIG